MGSESEERLSFNLVFKIDIETQKFVVKKISVKIKDMYILPTDMKKIMEDLSIIEKEREKIKCILKNQQIMFAKDFKEGLDGT